MRFGFVIEGLLFWVYSEHTCVLDTVRLSLLSCEEAFSTICRWRYVGFGTRQKLNCSRGPCQKCEI